MSYQNVFFIIIHSDLSIQRVDSHSNGVINVL